MTDTISDEICSLSGEYAFLSPTASCWISIGLTTYPNAVQAFLGLQRLNYSDAREIAKASSIENAIRIAARTPVNSYAAGYDWKRQMLVLLLREQFREHSHYARLLRETGERPITTKGFCVFGLPEWLVDEMGFHLEVIRRDLNAN